MAKRPRRRDPHLYARSRGGVGRFYADLRSLGGGREALTPSGEKLATDNRQVALVLLAERVKELEARRLGRALGVDRPSATLGAFARDHLMAKAQHGATTEQWLARSEMYLRRACSFFGAERELASIGVEDVERWAASLSGQRSSRGAGLGGGTVLHHLHTLSNLYRRAIKRRLVPIGYNPVAALEERPRRSQVEATWLEVPEAALFLEAARTLPRRRGSRLVPFLHPLLATFLLTGGRFDEVAGLMVQDVSFERGTVRFRPTPFRRGKKGKTREADRVVPLWPQLREILGDYLMTRPPSQLLFPVWRGGQERAVRDMRGALLAVERWAGLPEGRLTSKALRHSYCSARLQTMDRGEPVSLDTVRREMGHANDLLVQRVYGHLGAVRHRAPVVEYRVEQHIEILGDQLRRLQARANLGTTVDTTQGIPLAPAGRQDG